jgi:hypothetical protein
MTSISPFPKKKTNNYRTKSPNPCQGRKRGASGRIFAVWLLKTPKKLKETRGPKKKFLTAMGLSGKFTSL